MIEAVKNDGSWHTKRQPDIDKTLRRSIGKILMRILLPNKRKQTESNEQQ